MVEKGQEWARPPGQKVAAGEKQMAFHGRAVWVRGTSEGLDLIIRTQPRSIRGDQKESNCRFLVGNDISNAHVNPDWDTRFPRSSSRQNKSRTLMESQLLVMVMEPRALC